MASGTDDPFHDPLLIGIAVAFVLVAILTTAISPAAGGHAWAPFLMLSTAVGVLSAWIVASDRTPRAADTAPFERAA